MAHRVIDLFIIILIIHNVSSYWLSQNRLSWNDASNYCQIRCNSHLASILNQNDFIKARDLINNETTIIAGFDASNSADYRIWIGLRKTIFNDWTWTDGSAFDFGQSEGIFPPWNGGEPSSLNNEDCVQYKLSGKHMGWGDKDCSRSYRFLCNSCEGVLDKYILYPSSIPYADALSACTNDLGTSLGSIHNQDDMHAMTALCRMGIDDACWSGLDRLNSNKEWQWTDETSFDYGTDISGGIYPWKKDEPSNKECVELYMNNTNGEWNAVECNRTHRYLCNKPNDFCYMDNWDILNDKMIFRDCMVESIGDEMAVISNKRWNNNNWPLKIEYLFKVHDVEDVSRSAETGIVIFYGDNSTIYNNCDYSFIGLSIQNNSNILVMETPSNNDNMSISIQPHTYHQLNVELVNEYTILATLDNISMEPFTITSQDQSKYIGIRNSNVNVTGKTLFVSGTPEYGTYSTPLDCTELLHQTDLWINIDEGQWEFDTSIGWIQTDSTKPVAVAMKHKQLYNSNNIFSMNYTFSMDFLGIDAQASGIEIYNSQSGLHCEAYFIGIFKYSKNMYYITLERGSAAIQYDDIAYARIPDLSDNKQYTLRITITNGNQFNVAFDGTAYITFTDTASVWSPLQNGYSGYISLWSDKNMLTTAHSLYIDGTLVDTAVLDTDRDCTAYPTSQPTTAPILMPSSAPSKPSTVNPTTSHPVIGPSANPTAYPSSSLQPSITTTLQPATDSPTDLASTSSTTDFVAVYGVVMILNINRQETNMAITFLKNIIMNITQNEAPNVCVEGINVMVARNRSIVTVTIAVCTLSSESEIIGILQNQKLETDPDFINYYPHSKVIYIKPIHSIETSTASTDIHIYKSRENNRKLLVMIIVTVLFLFCICISCAVIIIIKNVRNKGEIAKTNTVLASRIDEHSDDDILSEADVVEMHQTLNALPMDIPLEDMETKALGPMSTSYDYIEGGDEGNSDDEYDGMYTKGGKYGKTGGGSSKIQMIADDDDSSQDEENYDKLYDKKNKTPF